MSIDTSKVATSNRDTPATVGKPSKVAGAATWADERLGLATAMKKNLRKVFPDHWSFMLGEIALWSFVVLLLTGVFLTLWFTPSMGEVHYEGSYSPLRGIEMSEAYASSLKLSFDVRGGLLMRQMHHWAAMLFVASMMIHLLRVYFTGAYRKPRELNWVIGSLLLLLGTLEGFTGYSLPDDLLSGTGIRAADGFMKSMPVVGTYMSFFLFGGEFPGESIIPRLFTVHVLLIPGLLLALIAAHMLLLVYHKHTQWPGPGRTEENVVGFPMLPVYAAKAGGFFFIVFGVTALMGGLLSINPVWKFGPYDPSKVTAGSQPDWYMGWPDGALRIMPGIETHLWGHTMAWNVFLPIIVLPGLMFTILMMLPFLESWVTGDKRNHHLLRRPRNAPTSTGDHGRADDVLRPHVGGRWQRHHRHQAAPEHQPDHVLHAGRGLHRAGHRLHHRAPLVHLAPAPRRGGAAARLRDRDHHALSRGRLRRAAPADRRRPGVRDDRPRPRRGLRARRRRRTPTACPRRAPARRSCAPGSPGCGSRTTSSRPPARSSTRRTTTPSTSTSCRPPSRATRPTATSSTATTRSTTRRSARTEHRPTQHHPRHHPARRPARDRSSSFSGGPSSCADPSLVDAVRRRPVACSRRTTPTRRLFTREGRRPVPCSRREPTPGPLAQGQALRPHTFVQPPLDVRGAAEEVGPARRRRRTSRAPSSSTRVDRRRCSRRSGPCHSTPSYSAP